MMNDHKSILIEITNKCLVGCDFCYQHFGYNGENLTIDNYNNILKFVDDNGISEISLTGGDVFLNPFLPEMIRIARASGKSVTLLANANANREDICNWIISGGKINLTFSDFGARSIALVNFLCVECSSIKNVHFVITVMNQSCDELCTFIRFLNAFNITPEVNFAFLNEKTYIFLESMLFTIERLIILTLQGSIKIVSEYVTAAIKDYVNCKSEIRCSLNKKSKIDVYGNLFPCPFLYKKEHALQNIITGEFYRESVACQNIIRLREKFSACGKCKFFEVCKGGCPVEYFYGNLFNEHHCKLIHKSYRTIELLLKV